MSLRSLDPGNTGKFKDKAQVLGLTTEYLGELYKQMYLLFAEDRRALLIILQGIDASGKDGVIRHIYSGANPQGIRSYSFKAPSEEELKHDFLWRCQRLAPERGSAAIFNRSYYEDVTTVKVHPEYLDLRKPVPGLKPHEIFEQRYRQINDYERTLTENGTTVLKFFLHISKDEQKKRLEERLEDPTKHWKFSPDDLKERKLWDKYVDAYGAMIKKTNTKHAPWMVIPADKKWYRNYLITKKIAETLSGFKMEFPRLPKKRS